VELLAALALWNPDSQELVTEVNVFNEISVSKVLHVELEVNSFSVSVTINMLSTLHSHVGNEPLEFVFSVE